MLSSDYLKQVRQQGQRAFSLEQFMSDLHLSKNAALVAVHRLKQQQELISPARGFYVIVPPEHQLYGSIPAQELVPLLMQYWQADYYVSLLSSAQYHGATHQKSAHFQIISNKRIKQPLQMGQVSIEPLYKKSLENLPIKKMVVSSGYLNVASPELTAMDLLLYTAKSGGLNHIATVISELIEAIDPDALIALAKSSKNSAWIQRLGYILEKIEPMDQEKNELIINKLSNYIAHKKLNFIPLASEISVAGFSRDKKWNIIENTSIESDE